MAFDLCLAVDFLEGPLVFITVAWEEAQLKIDSRGFCPDIVVAAYGLLLSKELGAIARLDFNGDPVREADSVPGIDGELIIRSFGGRWFWISWLGTNMSYSWLEAEDTDQFRIRFFGEET